jgi:hypothetical protein
MMVVDFMNDVKVIRSIIENTAKESKKKRRK